MIDDKKIEEAIEDYVRYSSVEDEYPGTEGDAFKAGVEWAINEFLKECWHPVSEEPDVRHKTIICLHYDGTICEDEDVYCIATEHYNRLGRGKFNWNLYAEGEEIEKWCYKCDLFPKEGGNHD